MSVGHTCGYMDVQGVQYWLVPSGITPDTYVLVRVHLLGCPMVFKPLFTETFTVGSPLIYLLQGNAGCNGSCHRRLLNNCYNHQT